MYNPCGKAPPPPFFFALPARFGKREKKGSVAEGLSDPLKCPHGHLEVHNPRLRTTALETTKYTFKWHSVCYFSASHKARYMKRKKNIYIYRLRCNYMFLASHARIISFACWRDLFHTVKTKQECLHKISAPHLFRYVTGLQVFTLMVHSRAA